MVYKCWLLTPLLLVVFLMNQHSWIFISQPLFFGVISDAYWRRKWQPTPVFLPGESPWTEEPGRLESMGLPRVGHDWVTVTLLIFIKSTFLIFYPFTFLISHTICNSFIQCSLWRTRALLFHLWFCFLCFWQDGFLSFFMFISTGSFEDLK